ncbi:aspartyl/asparaginyl beta-hydroxylase domain-containing protein [Paraburkholderia rhizosphaerae]|uniref:Aspartyl/asparaginyl beta-hydroxylase n=1 Tax=Paraburkholderia rhizosphaerae TaxID=480658 RepID=A0A4R8LQR2_9BURK|nr:aspartyl/asparaginyl beta-hydroxylase domain-containing protein [Paraburkholderia rhizosphaerae]TDY49768.1 aspartyl/asparaginyl beta-hydroxylase [Paraburkholderia rhizosphaerae]
MVTATRLVGRIKFDDTLLRKDLKVLSELPLLREQYDEFGSGTWINHSLWNRSGEWTDTQYSDYNYPAIRTQVGATTTYLSKIIEECFDVDHLRMARVRNLVNGLVIPHTDFLELSEEKDRYVRILIPLETCIDSYHTEEKFGVFRMRKGDIWILESTLPHGALNFASDNRRILSLDFQYADIPAPHYSLIFKDHSIRDEAIPPALVSRTQLEPEDLHDYLEQLSTSFNDKDDAEHILVKLSKVHLRFESPVSDIYKNLTKVAKMTQRQDLVEHCEKMQKFYIGSRVMNERFPLRKGIC